MMALIYEPYVWQKTVHGHFQARLSIFQSGRERTHRQPYIPHWLKYKRICQNIINILSFFLRNECLVLVSGVIISVFVFFNFRALSYYRLCTHICACSGRFINEGQYVLHSHLKLNLTKHRTLGWSKPLCQDEEKAENSIRSSTMSPSILSICLEF